MKKFNEQKTVCSEFPFYSLDNEEIQEAAPKQNTVQKLKTVHFYISKLKNLQQENTQLKSTITHLEEHNGPKKTELTHAETVVTDLQTKLSNAENKLKIANSVISNLKEEICAKRQQIT